MNTEQGRKLAVYFCVGSAYTDGRELLDIIREAVLGGVTTVQLREKKPNGITASTGKLLEIAKKVSQLLVDLSEELGERPLLIINDRVDVAIALFLDGYKIDGVHLGQEDLRPDMVGTMLDAIGWNNAIIGLSCRDEDALARAADLHAAGALDYVGMGPLHSTNSKPGLPEGLGEERWAELANFAHKLAPHLPILGIGGVTPKDAAPLKSAGANGYCCITYIAQASDVKAAAQSFAHAWRSL